MAMRRRLYPMPVEALVDHPELLAMPVAGAGMVFRLALHFWATGCRPLPSADHELRAIARAHPPTWRVWKASVLNVLEDIRPELEAYRLTRETKADQLRIAGQTGADRKRARKRARQAEDATLALASASPLPVREANPEARPNPMPVARAKARTLVDAPTGR